MNFMDIRFYSSRTGLNWRPRQIHRARRGHASARLTGCITKRGTAIAFVNIIVFLAAKLTEEVRERELRPFSADKNQQRERQPRRQTFGKRRRSQRLPMIMPLDKKQGSGKACEDHIIW